jgi:hypothetical protein
MKRNLLISLVGLAVLFSSWTAQAMECKGVDFPEQVQVEGVSLALNGLGLRQATLFKVNVYVAGLYLAQISPDAEAILESITSKKLVLQFLRDVGKKDLNKAWDKGFADNAPDLLPALQDRVDLLTSWMSDMTAGQQLVFTYMPAAGIEVNVNGSVQGMIPGNDFARAFLSIWLGSQPPNPGLKTGLLGGVCE